ncbi:Uncharacterised protein [Salmonella enterica subsp. enterica serovar Sanjuan]|uniref:Uncharacterized protein n=1 Tax=Salmonella enterica subsp. enterica serovar Sanjuan TaxID=1160765 RepID=A0A447NKD7_SALET|nr:Uncharacterised protein [Salmonella enterica subsp. enterica serovar Sanjuan]
MSDSYYQFILCCRHFFQISSVKFSNVRIPAFISIVMPITNTEEYHFIYYFLSLPFMMVHNDLLN